ncbi:MAG: fasciclin domain-containing protein [Saprospiraceae bacterium]|nr:fasciclin domain-containing protein [Candidatus Vicinibacter affinis]
MKLLPVPPVWYLLYKAQVHSPFCTKDAAFAALPPGTVEALLKILREHLLKFYCIMRGWGNALSTGLTNGQFIKTINGKSVNVSINKDGVFINNAKVTVADVLADNGVVHILDAVLLPPAGSGCNCKLTDTTVRLKLLRYRRSGTCIRRCRSIYHFCTTDAAFAALPTPGTVEALLKDLQGALTKFIVSCGWGECLLYRFDKWTIHKNHQWKICKCFDQQRWRVHQQCKSNGFRCSCRNNDVVHVVDAVLYHLLQLRM